MVLYSAYQSKIWIDRGAVCISTSAAERNGFSGRRKGYTAEVSTAARAWMLGRRRISAGLSQFFVKRYQWPFGDHLIGVFLRIPMDRFACGPFFRPYRKGNISEFNKMR